MDNKSPYINSEKIVMDNLVNAFNTFTKLEQTHPDHLEDFKNGIHRCQDILMNRIVQREYPNEFPIYTQQGETWKKKQILT